MQIERNTLTTISKLQAGDRFYRAGDKKKIIFEKIEHEIKKTFFQTYKHFALERVIADSPTMKPENKLLFAKPMKPDTEVIFLTHKTKE